MSKRGIVRSVIAAGCSGAMILGGAAPALALNTQSWDIPTSETPVVNSDGVRWATGTGQHGSAVAGEYVGLSQVVNEIYATTGNGIDTTNYKYNPYFGIFGTTVNENPDPYVANLMYNWYVEEQGDSATLQKSDNAMINYLFTASKGSAIGLDNDSQRNGTSITLSFRPDVLGLSATYTNQWGDAIKAINNISKDSEYYQAASDTYVGDENYDPVIVGYDESNFIKQTQNIYNYAKAADQVEKNAADKGLKIATRYGDSLDVAQQYELATKGSILYTLSKIDDGTVNKKTVAYVKSIDGTGKDAIVTLIGNCDPRVSREKTHHMEGLVATTNNLANVLNPDLEWEDITTQSQEVTCSVAQLAKADVIILALPDNLSYNFKSSDGAGVTWTKKGSAADEDYGQSGTRGDGEGHYKNQFWGPQEPTNTLVDNIKAALNAEGSSKAKKLAKKNILSCVQEGSSSSDGGSIEAYSQYPLMNAFVYPEIASQTEQYGYWLDKIAHIKTDKVSEVTQRLCCDLTLADGKTLDFTYNDSVAKRIQSTYEQGINYYLSNKNLIDAQYPWLELTGDFDTSAISKSSQTLKASNLKIKRGKSAWITVKGAYTSLTFKSNKKKVTVTKAGKVKVKKGAKKGLKAKITIKAKADNYYKSAKTTIRVTVK